MTTYPHRCPECGATFEATQPTSDRLHCRMPGCPGRPERVPGVVLYRSDPEPVPGDEP